MARRRAAHRRRDAPLVLSLVGGVLLGLSAAATKLGLQATDPQRLLPNLPALLNPWLAAAGVMGICGFLLFQKSLASGRLAVLGPLAGGVSVVLPSATGVLVFGEVLSSWKALGIVFILLGVAACSTESSGARKAKQNRRLIR